MNNVTISVKFRQVVKKTGKTETYNTEELAQLNNYLDGMYAETNDAVFLAVKLNFMLGLRVGELVALKPGDIENDMIHVIREEIRDQTTNTYEVVEHTKTNTDRFVALVSKSKKSWICWIHMGNIYSCVAVNGSPPDRWLMFWKNTLNATVSKSRVLTK